MVSFDCTPVLQGCRASGRGQGRPCPAREVRAPPQPSCRVQNNTASIFCSVIIFDSPFRSITFPEDSRSHLRPSSPLTIPDILVSMTSYAPSLRPSSTPFLGGLKRLKTDLDCLFGNLKKNSPPWSPWFLIGWIRGVCAAPVSVCVSSDTLAVTTCPIWVAERYCCWFASSCAIRW